jgi:hypothetical protein
MSADCLCGWSGDDLSRHLGDTHCDDPKLARHLLARVDVLLRTAEAEVDPEHPAHEMLHRALTLIGEAREALR